MEKAREIAGGMKSGISFRVLFYFRPLAPCSMLFFQEVIYDCSDRKAGSGFFG
jgi:hypothetical protein